METDVSRVDGKGVRYNKYDEILITCGLCETRLTTMTGTKRCDRCWELESRVKANPELTQQILDNLHF